MRYITTTFLLALFVGSLHAQPEIDAINLYDRGQTIETFRDIYLAANGDYLVCGQSSSRPWVVRINGEGRKIWEFLLEESLLFFSLIEADNGDIIVVGILSNHTFGAIRLTSDGHLVWRNEFGAGRAHAVIELKEGDFLICGNSAADGRGYVTRISEDGNQIWERIYDDERSIFYGMRETDEGVILCGHSNFRGLVKKITLRGEEIWTRHYGDELSSQLFSSMVSIPQGFAIGAASVRDEVAYAQIVKINPAGEVISDNVIDEVTGVFCEGIAKSGENSFVLVGQQIVHQQRYPVCIRLDQNGQYIWSRNFHELVDDSLRENNLNSLNNALILPGNVIIGAGALYNNFRGRQDDALLVRLTPDPLYPSIFYKSPEDSLLTVLKDESLQFVVRARDRYGRDLNYEWFYGDSLFSPRRDTSRVVVFDTLLGDYQIVCRVSTDASEIRTGWQVTVTDLYISAFTPDTLALTLHRGATVDFSLDTIRFTDGDEPEILWTKTNLSNGQAENSGEDAQATVDFPWSGDYEVEGRVSRGESSDAVTWSVAVRGAIWAFVPEADSLEVLPDSVVHFEVVPSAPEDESLTIQWFVDGELVREGEVALDWAFGEADSCPPHHVICVVADSVEVDSVAWVVEVRELGVRDPTVSPPRLTALLDVSPNPFNSTLTIRYATGGLETAATRLTIHDINGRVVAELMTGDPPFNSPPASKGGNQTLVWDASTVPAGVYFVRLQAGREVVTRKVVLMR